MATVWILMQEITYYKNEYPTNIDFVSSNVAAVYDNCEKAFKALGEFEDVEIFSGGLDRIIGKNTDRPHLRKIRFWVEPPREVQ